MENQKNGYVLDIEGIDGCGKTTAIKYLAQKLEEAGLKVLVTKENGNQYIPFAVEMRRIILDPNNTMDNRAMEMVFAAMRIENDSFIKQKRTEYDVILSDRGWLSHLAYTDHNVSEQFTKEFWLDWIAKFSTLPDHVMFLDASPETASERRRLRGDTPDKIEAKGDGFQAKVYASFLKYIDQHWDKFPVRFIDSEEGLDGVKEQIDELAAELVADLFIRNAQAS